MMQPAQAQLLSQASDHISPLSTDLLESPSFVLILMFVTGLLIVLIVAFLILRSMKQAERARELQHIERTKAIEAGQPWKENPESVLPESSIQEFSLEKRFWICVWIMIFGSATPFMSISGLLKDFDSILQSTAITSLICAGVASIAASVCSAVIMTSKLPSISSPKNAD